MKNKKRVIKLVVNEDKKRIMMIDCNENERDNI